MWITAHYRPGARPRQAVNVARCLHPSEAASECSSLSARVLAAAQKALEEREAERRLLLEEDEQLFHTPEES